MSLSTRRFLLSALFASRLPSLVAPAVATCCCIHWRTWASSAHIIYDDLRYTTMGDATTRHLCWQKFQQHSLFLSASSAVGIVASVALTFVGLTCCCSREPLISPRPSTVVSERRGIDDDDDAAVNNVTPQTVKLIPCTQKPYNVLRTQTCYTKLVQITLTCSFPLRCWWWWNVIFR